MSAVSKRFTPASSAASTIALAAAASAWRPNALQPTPTTETTSPESPSLRYRMSVTPQP